MRVPTWIAVALALVSPCSVGSARGDEPLEDTVVATDADSRRFALNVSLGFLPLALLGLAFQETIEEQLFRPVPVAIALVIGGIAILIVDRRASRATLDAVAAVPVRTV